MPNLSSLSNLVGKGASWMPGITRLIVMDDSWSSYFPEKWNSPRVQMGRISLTSQRAGNIFVIRRRRHYNSLSLLGNSIWKVAICQSIKSRGLTKRKRIGMNDEFTARIVGGGWVTSRRKNRLSLTSRSRAVVSASSRCHLHWLSRTAVIQWQRAAAGLVLPLLSTSFCLPTTSQISQVYGVWWVCPRAEPTPLSNSEESGKLALDAHFPEHRSISPLYSTTIYSRRTKHSSSKHWITP